MLLHNDSEELKSWGRSDEDSSCHTASTILSDEDDDDSEDQTENLDMMMETSVVEQDGPTRRVQFSTIEIREYNLTIGDHPLTESYPLSLDWDYYTTTSNVPVEAYETRPCHRLNATARKIRIALVSSQSLNDLTLQEAKRVTDLTEADMIEWFGHDVVQDASCAFSAPIKSSATMYAMSDKCDDMDISTHGNRHGRFEFGSDDSLLDFDDDDDFFEGF